MRYETRGVKKFYYFYDASGNLSAIRYSPNGGTTFYMYYILTNSRGDVVGIYSGSGVLLASYEYDAWGNCKITKDTNGIGELNPIRYRGYYYDTETGLYYLQSRYYNPQVGRFLNADGALNANGDLLGYNMFAYCGNNPVMYSDPSGWCHKFLGFLWKVDCKSTSCKSSRYYIAPKIVEPIGTYNNGKGNVYVVTEDQLDDITDGIEKNAVVVVDKRSNSDENGPNPDMQIRNSYRITNSTHQREIINIICDYNNSNPVTPAWNRTADSMYTEWIAHNHGYMLAPIAKIAVNRDISDNCRHVDFDNRDEANGYWDYYSK